MCPVNLTRTRLPVTFRRHGMNFDSPNVNACFIRAHSSTLEAAVSTVSITKSLTLSAVIVIYTIMYC